MIKINSINSILTISLMFIIFVVPIVFSFTHTNATTVNRYTSEFIVEATDPINISMVYGRQPGEMIYSVINSTYSQNESVIMTGLIPSTGYYFNYTICNSSDTCVNDAGIYTLTTSTSYWTPTQHLNGRGIYEIQDFYSISLGSGGIPWDNISDTSFPAACPAGQYVTAVNTSITCSTPIANGTENSSWSEDRAFELFYGKSNINDMVSGNASDSSFDAGLTVTQTSNLWDLRLNQQGDGTGLIINSTASTSPGIHINDTVSDKALVVETGDKICLNGVTCSKFIIYNGSHVVIEG